MSDFFHRISHCNDVSYPLLDRGILSIGWSGLAIQAEFLNGYKEDFDKVYRAFFNPNRSRVALRRFLNDIRENNRVLVPSWGCFHVYKIKNDSILLPKDLNIAGLKSWHKGDIVLEDSLLCYAEGSERIDLGFFREVELIEGEINRNQYSSPHLISMLKYRATNNQIDGLSGDINDAIKRKRKNQPINAVAEIHSTETVIAAAYKKLLENIHPSTLEELIKRYFLKAGANKVERSHHGDSKPGDVDITATFEAIKTIVRVQAKYHTGTTNEWAVQQIVDRRESIGSNEDYADVEMVISTGEDFSKECIIYAQKEGVLLINGSEFTKMLIGIGLYGLSG